MRGQPGASPGDSFRAVERWAAGRPRSESLALAKSDFRRRKVAGASRPEESPNDIDRRSSPAPGLRFLLDSADRAAWAEWLPLGCFHGVTTNPILLEAAGVACALRRSGRLARQAFDLGAGEIHIQTWGRTRDLYVEHGRALAAIDPRVVVKVPTTVEGAAAAARLREEGVRLTMTAVYSAAQALVASALGAEYAAPYLGRMNDAGRDGFAEIAAMARAARPRLVDAHPRRLAARSGRRRPPRRRGPRHVHLRPEARRRLLRRRPRGRGGRGVRGGRGGAPGVGSGQRRRAAGQGQSRSGTMGLKLDQAQTIVAAALAHARAKG